MSYYSPDLDLDQDLDQDQDPDPDLDQDQDPDQDQDLDLDPDLDQIILLYLLFFVILFNRPRQKSKFSFVSTFGCHKKITGVVNGQHPNRFTNYLPGPKDSIA